MVFVNYPLTLRIQIFSLSAKIEAVDAQHQPVCFVRKNRFKFREHVTVFTGSPPRTPLCEIRSEPTADYPVRYSFTAAQGENLGAVARGNSLHPFPYFVQDQVGIPVYEIWPRNPKTRNVDRFLSRFPLVRLLSAYVLHPALSIRTLGQQEVFFLQKRAAPLESRYLLKPSQNAPFLSQSEELRLLMAVLMTVFLEG